MRKQFLSATFAALIALSGCHAEMSVEPPVIVSSSFTRDHPGSTVNSVDKTQSGGSTQYKYTYTDSNGNKKTAQYDSQGNATH